MTEANDPARVLQILYDNLVSHRRALFQNLNKLIAAQSKAAMAIEQTANDADLQRIPYRPEMSMFQSTCNEIHLVSARIVAVDVQIQNLCGLAKGQYSYFNPPVSKGKETNVTSIVARAKLATPQTTGSTTQAGTVAKRTNPGVERQRQRKNAQNDK